MNMTVAEAWCRQLRAGGAEVIYSLSGVADNALSTALHSSGAFLRRVELQTAAAAVQAAAAGAQLTGRAAVCYADRYPALLQALPALAEAAAAGARVLVLGVLRERDSLLTAGEILPGVRLRAVQHAGAAECELAAALRRLQSGGGPQVLLLREDTAAQVLSRRTPLPEIHLPQPGKPQEAALQQTAHVLNKSARTVFLCGHGCRGARGEILALARRLQAPVVCMPEAREILEWENELAIGMLGAPGWGVALHAVAVCDVLVVWGAELPAEQRLAESAVVIGVYPQAAAGVGDMRAQRELCAEVRTVAAALLPLVRRQENDDFLRSMRTLCGREQLRSGLFMRYADESRPLRPEMVTMLVGAHAEPDAVFCMDTGQPQQWAGHFLHPGSRQRLLGAHRRGEYACALPMGIGAKAAEPSRQVLVLCTEKGLLQHAAELQTAVGAQLSVKVLVYMQRRQEGGPAAVSMAELGRCFGLHAEVLQRSQDAIACIRRWLAEEGPALLEVVADMQELPPVEKSIRVTGAE